MWRLGRNTLGFALIPAAGVLTPLLALPAISSEFGEAGWIALAIGQSVGAALATLVELGWGLNGPQFIARKSARSTLYVAAYSVQAKLFILSLASVVAFGGAALVSPSFKLEAGLIGVCTLFPALNITWIFLGKSRPWTIVFTDSVPRIAFTGLASWAILSGAPLAAYPVLGLLAPSIVSLTLGVLALGARSAKDLRLAPGRLIRASLRSQVQSVVARGASSIYTALSVTIVGVFSPAALPLFAAGERIMRIFLAGLSVLPSSMQGWVGRGATSTERWTRARRSLVINSVVAILAGATFGFFAPLAAAIIFSGVVEVNSQTSWAFAVVVFLICLSRAVGGIALVALMRIDAIARSALFGAFSGIPTIAILSSWLGALGGIIGEMISEAIVLCIQIWALIRARRSM